MAGAMEERTPRRASRLETVGAWLHIWTPRRDVHVPGAPWDRIAIGAAIVLLLVVLGLIMSVDHHHSSSRAQVHHLTAAERAAALHERARLKRVQAAHRARAT